MALLVSLAAGCAPTSGRAVPAPLPTPAAPTGAAGAAGQAGSAGQVGAGAATAVPDLLPMRVGYAAPSAAFLPVWIAQDAGLYAKYGINAELVNLGPNVAAPIMAGEVDVVQAAGPGVFAANLQGGDTVWIAVSVNKPVLQLLARPEIARPDDLRGRAVGVSARGTYTDQWMTYALRYLGLEAGRDVTVLATGGPAESVAAATSGRVEAVIMGPPSNLRALEAGMKLLFDLTTLDVSYPAGGVAASRKGLADKPDLMRRFMRAYVEAIHVYRTDPTLSQQVLARYTNTESPADLAESYRAFRDYTEDVPMPRLEAMQTALELMAPDVPEARNANPRDFYDDSLVRELEASGFIASLGK
jgi:ABC-type nitrate/sulfonate/bicarbonate transport system substrate-binding protein